MEKQHAEPKPPYLPWTSFENITDELRGKGLPQTLHRTAIQGKSGSTQTQYLSALRFLGFIDGKDRPTERFKTYVENPDQRKQIMLDVLNEKYSAALALGKTSTPHELNSQFRKYGVDGETGRKSIAFFLNAARFAGLELSPYWPQTRPGAGGRRRGTSTTPRRTGRRNGGKGGGKSDDEEDDDSPPVTTDAKSRYIDLLLKKAEEEMDDALLDRIERVIGVEGDAPEPGGADK